MISSQNSTNMPFWIFTYVNYRLGGPRIREMRILDPNICKTCIENAKKLLFVRKSLKIYFIQEYGKKYTLIPLIQTDSNETIIHKLNTR